MASALQVLIRLITVQVTVPLGVELKHLVAYGPAHLKTFLEGLLGLQLVFLDLGLLLSYLSHLQAEVS